jgi:hypothetical protein
MTGRKHSELLRDAFIQSRNSMTRALMEVGVDPLVTGAVSAHFEEMGFYLLKLANKVDRLSQRRAPRSAPRKKSRKSSGPVGGNVVAFLGAKAMPAGSPNSAA